MMENMIDLTDKTFIPIISRNTRIIDFQSGDSLFFINKDTNVEYVVNISKANKVSFKLSTNYNDKTIECILTPKGKSSFIKCDCLITFYIVRDKLHIVAPENIKIFK